MYFVLRRTTKTRHFTYISRFCILDATLTNVFGFFHVVFMIFTANTNEANQHKVNIMIIFLMWSQLDWNVATKLKPMLCEYHPLNEYVLKSFKCKSLARMTVEGKPLQILNKFLKIDEKFS